MDDDRLNSSHIDREKRAQLEFEAYVSKAMKNTGNHSLDEIKGQIDENLLKELRKEEEIMSKETWIEPIDLTHPIRR